VVEGHHGGERTPPEGLKRTLERRSVALSNVCCWFTSALTPAQFRRRSVDGNIWSIF
jgi:hypothetical protein